TITAVELLEKLYGIRATTGEAAYLNALAKDTFRYNTNVPEDGMTKIYNGEAGTLDIMLEAYVFTAANGSTVTWVPQRARIGEQEHTLLLREGFYTCQFTDLFHSDDFDVEIDFAWEVEIPAAHVEHLPNAAFGVGSQALETITSYETALATYTAAKQRYDAWVAYEEAVAAFERYQAAMDVYLANKAKYDQYVIDYTAYTAELAKWQAWRDYYAAIEFYTVKDENGDTGYDRWLEYDAYLTELDKVKKQLAPLEILFISDSRGWQVYASTMGDTVTRVLTSSRDELRKYGFENAAKEVDEEIDAADAATRALRPLLAEYAALRKATYATEHDKYVALYGFYTKNYTALRDHFSSLRWSLYEICQSGFFATACSDISPVKNQVLPKLPHLYQYIAQLYVVSTCLSDTDRQDANWSINKYNTLSSLLESVHRLADTHNADPTGATAPKLPQTAPEAIEFVPEAEKPAFSDVAKPTEPSFVAKPTQPDKVEQPAAYPNEKPDWWEAPDPGKAPAQPEVDAVSRALADEVKNGTLTARTVSAPARLSFTQTVAVPVSISNRMTVTFYGLKGEVLDRQQVEYGTEVIYRGPSTYIPADEANRYDFAGWVYADGTVANLLTVTKNQSIYAKYDLTPRVYTVTWILDGTSYQSNHNYGQTPECPVIPHKVGDKQYTYTFNGWDRELTPVTESTTYTGSFTAVPVTYTVTWRVGERTETESYLFGEIPVFSGSTELAADGYRYEFIGWDHTPTSVVGDATYVARFRSTPLATANDGTVQEVTHGESNMTVHATAGTVNLADAIQYALSQEKSLTVAWGACAVTFDGEALTALSGTACKKLSLVADPQGEGTVYTLRYLSSAGRELSLSVSATVSVTGESNGILYLRVDDEWQRMESVEGSVTVTGGACLLVRGSYRITVGITENCDVSSLRDTAVVGERVSLSLPCAVGYEVVSAKVVGADGSVIPVEDLSFVMPDGDVTVELTVARMVYRVTFVVNGQIWHEADYYFGDAVLLPAEPSLPSDGQYCYAFIGWSPTVAATASGKDRAPIYTANFSKTLLKEESPFEQNIFESFYFIVAMYALGFAVVVAGIVLIICFRKPLMARLRRRKVAKDDVAPSNQSEE
ncbi:MAG: hypothetical protein IJX62_06300, partial [Clostridia bacterium]|nr:hypothetical protein [Clostridia bacterium]